MFIDLLRAGLALATAGPDWRIYAGPPMKNFQSKLLVPEHILRNCYWMTMNFAILYPPPPWFGPAGHIDISRIFFCGKKGAARSIKRIILKEEFWRRINRKGGLGVTLPAGSGAEPLKQTEFQNSDKNSQHFMQSISEVNCA